MPAKAGAKRHAQAIFQIAVERDELERWRSDLSRIAALSDDRELVVFFENPGIPFEIKQKLVANQLTDVSQLVLNLVYLLISENGLEMIRQIIYEYQKLMNDYLGIEHALVTTAVPVDDEDRAVLEEQLGVMTGKKVFVSTETDPEILGGIVARINGKLLDGSTRSRLERLKQRISGSKI